ncbi:Hypp1087 [Branchiostoma lanceolatum]|uniref:Hypp1087 protein n=1 Tax=Branchiostoma lanceolatum TaxID=7740 RepID=A0A8J9ZEG8_BRALA|nr:Hypp1087 [Branchiostoma lanceolatum]
MKVLNSAVVKAQIKVVIEDLEEVLRELKKVAAELRVIIEQIDDITARIDQEEARMKSLQLLKGREDSMSLFDPRGRPNGQSKIQTAHCSHISDITGGARSRTRCEYPDILVSSPPQFQHLRETAIVDTQLCYHSHTGEGGHRQYNTIDTSELRKMQSASCVETKSQTLRTRGECRYSPVGAESNTGDCESPKSCTLDRRRDSTAIRLVTMRNGPIRTDCTVTASSTSVSQLIESEEALETCRQDTHSYVLHGTRLMHTCSGKDCGGPSDAAGGDTDSVLTIESTERLVRSRPRPEEYSCGDSIGSSLSIPVYDETASMMKKSTSGCFSCAAASNTDSYEELAVTSCLTTRRTWRSQTVSDARRRFFRPKVELRNGTGIRYHSMDDHVMKSSDAHLRDSVGAHSALSGSQTWLVSTGSQTTEDISDVEADERVKNYLRDFVNLRDEITKL